MAESVDVLAGEAQARTRNLLRDLSLHDDANIAKRATEGLRQIDLNQRLQDLSERLKSGNLSERVNAAEAVAATKTSKAASILIEAYLRAQTDIDRNAIGQAMRKYIKPEIWKFQLRRLKQENPQSTAILDKLMNARDVALTTVP